MNDEVEANRGERKPESPGCVFGIALGLVLIAFLLFSILSYGPRRTPAAELLAGSFELGELPEGMSLEDEALVVPGLLPGLSAGATVLTFRSGVPISIEPREVIDAAGPPEPGPEDPEDPEHVTAEGEIAEEMASEEEEYDWSAVKAEATDSLPARLYLVSYPPSRAPDVLAAQFRRLEWKDLSEIDRKGGTAVVGGGEISWAGYGADFVRQRRFIAGGSFRDTLRVNLSLGNECWIAYAVWPELHEGSEEAVSRVLEALRPVAQD